MFSLIVSHALLMSPLLSSKFSRAANLFLIVICYCSLTSSSFNDHYLVVAKIKERLAASKRPVNKMDMERFNLKKLDEGEFKERYQVTIKNRFTALENLRG
jgi:hypothetical protein